MKFLLLEDLGDALYRDFLAEDNVDEYFPALIGVLKRMAQDVDADLLVLTPWQVGEPQALDAWRRVRHRYGTMLITTIADTPSLHPIFLPSA